MEIKQDFFISHASADKENYVQPLVERLSDLGVTFWIDSMEIGWADSIVKKINDGLRECRHILLCLSEAFLKSPWAEAEMEVGLMGRIRGENGKLIPLILNSKEEVLNKYPLIARLSYLEYISGVHQIANKLASMARRSSYPKDSLHVVIESAHSGKLSNLMVSPRASIEWLSEQSRKCMGLKTELDAGGFKPFIVRWVLVDTKAESEWRELNRGEQQKIWAYVKTEDGIKISKSESDKLEDIGVYDDIIFHLYAIEDINWDITEYMDFKRI